MLKRTLDLAKFKSSLFLFGPRQVGKTFLIKSTLRPDIYIDLLKQSEFVRFSLNPELLSAEIKRLNKGNALVVIDEIQRAPSLLNEIHSILNDFDNIQFILTGSSARKLRQKGVNLLGGRAVTTHLYPLTYEELGELFSLDEIIKFGSIPKIFLEKEIDNKIRLMKSYVETYLTEEIQQEALLRNIPAFAKFLELAAYENGTILNFQNIARETAVSSKTIKEYFQILEDTLLGFYLYPYARSHRKKLVLHPKFYFFDCGIVSALKGEASKTFISGTKEYGRMFEHFVLLEIKRLLDYSEIEAKLSFFRTADGAEVDLIIELSDKILAVEIKSSSNPSLSDLRGLRSFIKDHKYSRAICVCQTPRGFIKEGIEFVSWQEFLEQLKKYKTH